MIKMTRKDVIGLIIAIFIYAVPVSWLIIRNITVPRELIDTIILAVLASATIFYAIRTSDIARATREQAEEIKKQRYAEALPLLVPTITSPANNYGIDSNDVPYWTLEVELGIKVMWRNLGKGVAINSSFSFLSAPLDDSLKQAYFFPPHEKEVLGIGEQKEIDFHNIRGRQTHDIPETYHPRLEAAYNDIYERKITTVQEFRVEEKNGNKRAFLGELYFTVNGKRFGEEIANHD